MGMAHLAWTVPFSLSVLLAGCVEPPGATRILGPDGTWMLHVHCADEQVACFQLAGERCPHGYDLSPIFDSHDGNFLVRCRDPQAAPSITARIPPAQRATSTSTSKSSTAADAWPPAEVATPTEPWPVQQNEAPPPATPRTRSGAVDIGY